MDYPGPFASDVKINVHPTVSASLCREAALEKVLRLAVQEFKWKHASVLTNTEVLNAVTCFCADVVKSYEKERVGRNTSQ